MSGLLPGDREGQLAGAMRVVIPHYTSKLSFPLRGSLEGEADALSRLSLFLRLASDTSGDSSQPCSSSFPDRSRLRFNEARTGLWRTTEDGPTAFALGAFPT